MTTTQFYTHITDKQLSDVHKNFHGKTEKGNHCKITTMIAPLHLSSSLKVFCK